jgi:hypothetical protein
MARISRAIRRAPGLKNMRNIVQVGRETKFEVLHGTLYAIHTSGVQVPCKGFGSKAAATGLSDLRIELDYHDYMQQWTTVCLPCPA